MIILGFAVSANAVWQASHSIEDSRVFTLPNRMSAYVLMTYHIQSDENIEKYLYPYPSVLGERVQFLELNNWSVFANRVVNPSSLPFIGYDQFASFDTINGENVAWASNGTRSLPIVINPEQQETITITGWAMDSSGSTVSAVWITIDGNVQIPCLYGLDKTSIASNPRNPNLRYSGFIASFSSSVFSSGNHTIYLTIASNSGQFVYRSIETVDLLIE
jgi:hypothetical protein